MGCALLERIQSDAVANLERTRANLTRRRARHPPVGIAEWQFEPWRAIVDDFVDVLVGADERLCELRRNAPFAGCSQMKYTARCPYLVGAVAVGASGTDTESSAESPGGVSLAQDRLS